MLVAASLDQNLVRGHVGRRFVVDWVALQERQAKQNRAIPSTSKTTEEPLKFEERNHHQGNVVHPAMVHGGLEEPVKSMIGEEVGRTYAVGLVAAV